MYIPCSFRNDSDEEGDRSVYAPAKKLGGTIETTGAGDVFCACVLNAVLEKGSAAMNEQEISDMLSFAGTAAYLITTKKGALMAMPERSEIEAIL